MATADLTVEALRELMAKFPPAQPSIFDSVLRLPKLGGMDVYVEPSIPKIQVNDIKLSDGTSILSKQFRDETNAWLLARFGYREQLCKDRMWLLGNYGIMVSRQHYGVIAGMLPA